MSKSVGFHWGAKLNEKTSHDKVRPESRKHMPHKGITKLISRKRRYDHETKPYVNEISINKRAKFPIIKGERLPFNRLIETLDRDSLNALAFDLINIHPEICKTIQDINPKVNVEQSMEILNTKYEAITKNLPYKGDVTNDYSYLRIKPYLNEFLNCMSDFILNYLPPVENNFLNSSKFIDFAITLILKLPNFNNSEFRYIKEKCQEQMANTWLIILNTLCSDSDVTTEEVSEISDEKLFNFIKIVNDLNLKEKMSAFNESTDNKFQKVLEYIDDKFNLYHTLTNTNSSSPLNELITIDYSNYSLTAHPST